MDKAYKESYRKLGLNIAFYRKDRGLTQMQLAELLDIDRSHMSAIELATVGVSLGQYRTTATIRITGRPFCKNQLGRPCFCSQERTDSSC